MWKRILEKKEYKDIFKPIDRLYVEFDKDKFEGIKVNDNLETELASFINDIRSGSRKFNDYTPDEIQYFASRIYELRKNNSNNAT